METIYIKQGEKVEIGELVATIGFFDGVHRGHQYLIRNVVDEAHRVGMVSAVITFDEHPRQVLTASLGKEEDVNSRPELLSSLDEKLLLLSKTGIDKVIVLHFDVALADLSAREFMEDVLRNQLNVRKLFIGYDNRFGHNRSEGFDDYKRYGEQLGIEVIHNNAYLPDGEKISSSQIRTYIKEGDIVRANHCLGYDYTICSKIVSGFQNGHKLGFPTANLDINACQQLLPMRGVYAVMVQLDHSLVWKRGMMNIGKRPTFDGTKETLEVNIFNFEDNLYGQDVSIRFISKIRDERKFDSLEALSQQLEQDKHTINALFDRRHPMVDNIVEQ